jgi:hypothetical protein
VAKFAIAKQRHQDGITENQVIITSYVHYFGMDFDHTQLPVEDICQVYCLLWSVRLIPTLGTSPLNSDESIAEISSNKKFLMHLNGNYSNLTREATFVLEKENCYKEGDVI